MQPTPHRSDPPTASGTGALDHVTTPNRVAPSRLIARKELPDKKGLRRKPVTFWRWEQAGRLTPIRIGGLVYYDEAQVDELMARGDAMSADSRAA